MGPQASFYQTLPSLSCEVKVDDAKGRVEGYANTFRTVSNPDNHGDAVLPGAFRKTIQERHPANLIKVLYWHRDLIGTPEHLEEDSRGLFTVSRFDQTPEAQSRLEQVRSGSLGHLSIGFDPIREELVRDDNGFVVGRQIREVKLYEYSFVPWPADEGSVVTAVKSLHEQVAPLFAQLEDLGGLLSGKSASPGQRELLRRIDQQLVHLRGRMKQHLGDYAPDAGTQETAPPASTRGDEDVWLQRLTAAASGLKSDLEITRSTLRIQSLRN